MSSFLRDLPASSGPMTAVFDDAATLRAALGFEAALARAAAAEGLIPRPAAELVAAYCDPAYFEPAALAEQAAHAGTLAIPLVRQLRTLLQARDPEAATCVHFGATSQDLADTVLVLQMRAAGALVLDEGRALMDSLASLAERHRHTPALGRTLLQSARPITFGLRCAHWLLALHAALRRFESESVKARQLQLGGPVGTLAGLSVAVAERVAAALQLEVPPMPWHTRRDGIAGTAAALGILSGAAGKLARDIALLSQSEIAEAFEPHIAGRGGSSSMPYKHNPTACQVALSAATRAPGLVASILAGLPQEHERGLGGWQAEAPVLASLFELVHSALASLRVAVAGLQVDSSAMLHNLQRAAVGEDAGHAPQLIERALRHCREH